jgi:NADH:ubiquinone oxidoreductase subunit 2 (subunit N)
MSLLIYLVACGAGSALGLSLRPTQFAGRAAGIAGLLAAFVSALSIGAGTTLQIGDVALVGGQYAGLFLACAAGTGLLLSIVALAADWPDDLAPAALAVFAGLAIATTATDPLAALTAGAAAATAGSLMILRYSPESAGIDGQLAEIRTITIVAVAFVLAGMTVVRPPWSDGDGPVLALSFAAVALALAVRSGAVPFHIPASHLAQTGKTFAQAVVLVWIPAGLGLLALSWSALIAHDGSGWLNLAVALIQVVAIGTILLGALAALVHDELEEIVAYSIVADAGFVLLALAARSDAAAQPARLWLLVFIASKTALVAWAAAMSRAYGTSTLGKLRGWLRKTPLLGFALAAIFVATIGWPGNAVYEARSDLVNLALPGVLKLVFFAALLLTLAYVARVLAVGLFQPTVEVAAAEGELPTWFVNRHRARQAQQAQDATPASTPTEADAADSAPAAGTARRKRRKVSAAAMTSDAATVSTPIADAAPSDSTDAPADTTPAPGRRGARAAQLTAVLLLNRTLVISLVVVVGTALTIALASGGFNSSGAARAGIPLDQAAHATATPTPVPTLGGPSPTPAPTLAPRPSGSFEPGGSASPTPTATPVKTSAPVKGDAG